MRATFPRLHFVSDSLLLEALASGPSPQTVPPELLQRCFRGLTRLLCTTKPARELHKSADVSFEVLDTIQRTAAGHSPRRGSDRVVVEGVQGVDQEQVWLVAPLEVRPQACCSDCVLMCVHLEICVTPYSALDS
jgi:hypothetical protein